MTVAPAKLISIIASCYNEVGNIDACYTQIRDLFEGDTAPLKGYQWELIFSDNASEDGTGERLRALASDPHVKVIFNARNFGASPSGFNGCFAASGDVIVFQSTDLQDPPAMIPEYIRCWEEGNEVVYGIRQGRKPTLLLKLSRHIYYKILNRLAPTQVVPQSNIFLMTRVVAEAIKSYDDFNPLLRGLVPLMGFKSAVLPVPNAERTFGKSSFNFFSYLDEALGTFIRLSRFPLRIALFLGFLLAGISFLLGFGTLAWLLIDLIRGVPIESLGMRLLIFGGLFLFGLQMLFLGIIGEYIGAIHSQVRKGPLVIEKERLNFSPTANKPDGRLLPP